MFVQKIAFMLKLTVTVNYVSIGFIDRKSQTSESEITFLCMASISIITLTGTRYTKQYHV